MSLLRYFDCRLASEVIIIIPVEASEGPETQNERECWQSWRFL